LLQFGVGLVMPNAKILSLGRLPKAYSSTANSIVKLSQIGSVAIVQFVAAFMANSIVAQVVMLSVVTLLGAAVEGYFLHNNV